MPIHISFLQSPLGIIEIKATDEYITAVLFRPTSVDTPAVNVMEEIKSNHPLLTSCENQLKEYFAGQRRHFNLPIYQEGSAFQQKVWAALTGIAYGRTISYLELSKRIGNAKAIRAVGTTNGNNAISIIVPCHRVIGSDGSLTGYSGELWRKKWLLEHEGKYANGVQTLF